MPQSRQKWTEHAQAALLDIGQRIKALRAEEGLTAEALAHRAGISLRLVRQVETGKANIAIGRLQRIADALSVHVAQLILPIPANTSARQDIEEFERADDTAQREAWRAFSAQLHRHRTPTIALLGLRGAGKTTVGAALADKLNVAFVELDAKVEDAAGLTLPEVFELHGEPYYRRVERQCLDAILTQAQPAVVALSGGIVQETGTYAAVLERTLTVWLQADPEIHMRRVRDQGDLRPMRNRENAMAELRALLAAREPEYKRADISLNTTQLSVEAVVAELAAAITSRTAKRSHTSPS